METKSCSNTTVKMTIFLRSQGISIMVRFSTVIGFVLMMQASYAAHDPFSDGSSVMLESFDSPNFTWQEMNDPVMGGKSTGTFTIEDGLGKFEGEVKDVPFLHAPGFIQARTKGGGNYPDVSDCQALEIVAKSNSDYDGYRISFGNAHAPGGKNFAYGYKSDLKGVPTDGTFGSIIIPFQDFTDFWDDATGDAIHTCHENELFCPDELTLKDMQRLAVWGEGKAGKVSLEIKTISAVGCGEKIAR